MDTPRRQSFDSPALYAALDTRRRARGISWQQVAREIGVAPSTIGRTKKGGPMETDGILVMVRWLDCNPEQFIRGSDQNRSGFPIRCEGRFDTKALYEALNEYRRSHQKTWVELARDVGGVSPGMLTRLSKGGRVNINLVVAITGYLGRAARNSTRKERAL